MRLSQGRPKSAEARDGRKADKGFVPAFLLLALFAAVSSSAQSADELLGAGRKAFSDGFYPVAADTFQRVLSDYPQAPAAIEAEYLLGVSQYYAGRWRECLAVLERFRERHPGSGLLSRVPYWLGAAYLRLGSYETALQYLKAQAGASESSAGAAGENRDEAFAQHAVLLSGVALEGLGKDAEAGSCYRRVIAGGNATLAPEAAYRLAGTEYRAGRFPQARELYGRVLIGFPQSQFVRDSLFFLAECDLALGNRDAAEKRFSMVISLYPDSPYREAALFRLADTAYRSRDLAAALRRLDSLQKQFPRGAYRGSGLRMRGDIHFDQKKYEEAIAEYQGSTAELPDGTERQAAWYSLGLADLMLGRKSQAAEAFAKAGGGLAKDVGEKAGFQRCLLLAGLGRNDEAIAALDELVRSFPEGPHAEEALKLLASILDSRGDHEKSLARWDSLVKSFPRSPAQPEYLYRRGTVRMRMGSSAALDDFQRVLKSFPSSEFRDQSEYSVGYVYSRGGEYARALPWFESVAARAAGSEIADRSSLAIGVCLFDMGSFEKALMRLEELGARKSNAETHAIAVLYQGRTLYRMERLSEAAERLAAASTLLDALEPRSVHSGEAADARYWLGWSLYRTGKLAEARDAFLSLASSYPADPRTTEAMYRAGICETLRGDDGAAVELLDAAHRAEPSQAGDAWREQALYEKGWALARLGNRQESLETFRRLAAEFPDGKLAPEASFKVAMKAYDEGRYADARSGFQSVVRDYPKSGLVKQALYWTAECTRRTGDLREALNELWTSLSSDPGPGLLPMALQRFGEMLRSFASLETARDFAHKAKAAPGLDVQVVASVELDYADMLLPQEPSEALSVLDDVRRLSPPEPLAGEAALIMGRAYAARSEWQRAVDILAALSDTRGDEVGARATRERARALEATGDAREAINQYLRIGYLFPAYPDLGAEGMFNAARLALHNGDKESAGRITDGLRKRYPASVWVTRLDELR
ncbi:MAG TPA: tetratricopeptide repeat protein [Spirochaetia bacterium]|nr:tetratricopeptide repeat protein [Spirochaetia bacterium]